jgi:hypothetical protein
VTDIPSLTRPAFFDGQALTATDLQAVLSYHRDLLWLHQRTLHGTGIASGLGVAGAKGDKSVVVAPGYAIDAAGRSIVLDAACTLPIPAVVAGPSGAAMTYYLTVGYATDDQLAPTVRAGTCGSDGAVRRADAPILAWHEPNDAGDALVLCAIAVLNCKLAGPVDLSLRRSAIPDRQPFIYAGQSQPAATRWSLWRAGDSEGGIVLGLKATINTSEAGFANTPHYQACVVGSREIRQDPDDAHGAVLDGFVQVAAASSAQFELRMTVVPGSRDVNPDWALAEDRLVTFPVANRWYVSWLGVES